MSAPAGSYQAAILADSPILYYRLNDAQPSTTVADSSPSNDAGTVHGTVTFQEPGAVTGGFGALFDGTTGNVQTNSSLAALSNGSMTLECWMLSTSWPAGLAVAIQSATTATYLGVTSSGEPIFSARLNGVTRTLTASPALSTSAWHHVVAVWDGSVMSLYVDGVLNTSAAQTGPLLAASGTYKVGTGNSTFFAGELAEVAVYPYALGPGRVAAHYATRVWSAPTAGGFRPQNMQDLLGVIIGEQQQNSDTATTQAQNAVLNSLIGWGDFLSFIDLPTMTNGPATLWDNFVLNGGVFQ